MGTLVDAAARAFLINARREAKISQQELGFRLGWAQAKVARREGGYQGLSLAEFVAVCEALGVDPVLGLIAVTHRRPVGSGADGASAAAFSG